MVPCHSDRMRRLPWLLSLSASLVYFFLFYHAAAGRDNSVGKGLTDGFCVWGYTAPSFGMEQQGHCADHNSHQLSWHLDVGLALLVPLLYGRQTMRQQSPEGLLFVGIYVIFLVHGVLHWWISSRGCRLLTQHHASTTLSSVLAPRYGSWMNESMERWVGIAVYGIFTFILCMVLFLFGYDMEHKNQVLFYGSVSTLVALAATQLAATMAQEYTMSALFAIVHPIASCVGVTAKPGSKLTAGVGWSFLVATCTGLVELVGCQRYSVHEWGGHVWYDLTLGVSMLMSLLPVEVTKV